MEDQYERLQKVREKFLWNIAIKYKLALYNIKDTEKVYLLLEILAQP